MKRPLLHAFLPVAILAALLSLIALIPENADLLEPSVCSELPVGRELPGWLGERVQESEAERSILAADTRFSKACYKQLEFGERYPDPRCPLLDVSIVFSGQDMNSSIHRPELCLPSQGFQNLQGSPTEVELSNGVRLPFTRLSSIRPDNNDHSATRHFIHYYLFIGKGHLKATHLQRVMQDMFDRLFTGTVERWAYFQVGCSWGGSSGISEAEAEQRLRHLIAALLPRIIAWQDLPTRWRPQPTTR